MSATAASNSNRQTGGGNWLRPFFSLLLLSAACQAQAIRILTWNIDRGTHIDAIASTLTRENADIALLQEVDRYTVRANNLDVAPELARRTRTQFAYGIEFEELSQGQPGAHAYTGQATLSRLPIRTSRVLTFQHQSGFWKPRPWLPSSLPFFQRRVGARIALISEIEVSGRPLVIYNLHLESRSYGRIQLEQLDEVLQDMRQHYSPDTPVVLGGDINSKYLPAHYLDKMQKAGFQSATGSRIERTHTIAMTLDWLFVRGSLSWQNGRVLRDATGSDHYPVEGTLSPHGSLSK